MSSTFKILFYVRKNYVNKNGNSGIMIRVTLNGEMVQFSSKLEIDPKLWDAKSGKAMGKTKEAMKLNALLDNIRVSVTNHYQDLVRREGYVTVEKIRNSFLGHTDKQRTLLDLFKNYLVDLDKLVGISKTKATYAKYERTYRRLQDFMQHQYKITDIALKEINHKFVTDFETYLRTECGCGNNTTYKFIQFFKTIVLIAKNNGWIYADPFANYTLHFKPADRGYLTEEELSRIITKTFGNKRLDQVRDIFVFSCFTGLAYIDVKQLVEDDIRTSFDDGMWIMTKRQKTDTAVNVPVLKIPAMILEKYRGKLKNGRVLPVLSNQKMNSYLKEIADLCGINKNLTFHLARHTFATTTTLSKGVPIETVSKMLGHTNIKTTQIYARITNNKIGEDMKDLALKLNNIEKVYEINNLR